MLTYKFYFPYTLIRIFTFSRKFLIANKFGSEFFKRSSSNANLIEISFLEFYKSFNNYLSKFLS